MPRQSMPGVVGVDWDDDVGRTRRPARLVEWLGRTSTREVLTEPRLRLIAGGAAASVLVLLLWVL